MAAENAGARVFPNGQIPAQPGSELALQTIRIDARSSLSVGRTGCDELLFVFAGGGHLDDALDRHGTVEGQSRDSHQVASGSALLVLAGESATLAAGPDGLHAVRASVGNGVDLHAPMGQRERVVSVDEVEPGKATGSRSFQVLFGPHNGSTRATMFVGYIPPGSAPWHYHLYEEIVWVWRGAGRYHVAAGAEDFADGSAFHLAPREVHIVENSSSDRELAVVGIFTPAGSPSAAYLMPDVAASYAIG